jgi:hypothetical protein
MKIEISVFAAIVILFVLHTFLINLLNWWYRESSEVSSLLCLFTYMFEIIIVLGTLNTLLK